jgi:hypothetical protein
LGSHPLWRYQERGFWSGEAPKKAFWGMQIDVSGFSELRLTFAAKKGSQNKVAREKYFQKNRRLFGTDTFSRRTCSPRVVNGWRLTQRRKVAKA